MGVIKDTVSKLDLAGMSQAEKIAALGEAYVEIKPEMDEIVKKFQTINEFPAKLDMPQDRAWATMVLSIAEAMKLDLETPEGMGTAAILAHLQLGVG